MKHTAEIYGVDITVPCVMAVVNVTPDSFYAASRTMDRDALLRRVEEVVDEGCSIIDIGGYSSRPGADDVPADEEWRRVETGIRCVREVSPDIPISVDTFRADIALRAIESTQAVIINDISAGEIDERMVDTVIAADVPYVAMHMRGTPASMQRSCGYDDVATDVAAWLGAKAGELMSRGMRAERIILDAGFGFAKSTDECFALLAGLHKVCEKGYPVVAGLSRKSMIYKTVGATPEECLAGTAALNWEALRQGAKMLRVHDVREAVDTIRLFNRYKENMQ